jgi:hypothetical protein
VVEPRIEGEHVVIGSGRKLSLEELGALAERLPWVAAQVFIMPPHEYVVEGKLRDDEARETFEALRHASAHHPSSWKAFFRAYRSKNRYLVIGDHRYWYTQIRAARMMNRCDRESELENTRGGPGDRAITKWSGCAYAWKREYGLECENLARYCNLLVIVEGGPDGLSIERYAPMVEREAVEAWRGRLAADPPPAGIGGEIRRLLQGVESMDGVPPARSRQVPCSEAETGLDATWMRQKNMSPSRVATDLRWFSTAPRIEVERIFPLPVAGTYLVRLNVPPIS